MKLIIFITFLLNSLLLHGQCWTQQDLDIANTAKDVDVLKDEEKIVIQYMNLARMFPKKFIKCELKYKYLGINYRFDEDSIHYLTSLIETLETMEPVQPLYFDTTMQNYAKCYSKELGDIGRTGHKRKICTDGRFGECLSYGFGFGMDIVISLLVDDGVPSLGHREIILDPRFSRVGVSKSPHAKYTMCCVIDFGKSNLTPRR